MSAQLPAKFEQFLTAGGTTLFGYQRHFTAFLFGCWYGKRDGAIKMARQAGKTSIMAVWLAFMIIYHRARVVIISTKQQKTHKLSRVILRLMKIAAKLLGEELEPKGVEEARFGDDAGFVCLSGSPGAQRESESADIILVDESQDVEYHAVYPDLGPMRLMTGGIILCIGIGGVALSFMEQMIDHDDVAHMDVKRGDIEKEAERTRHPVLMEWCRLAGIERGRLTLTDFAAHFDCERIPDVENALIPYLLRWEDVYPDVPFNPLDTSVYSLDVGFDWGKRQDASAMLGVAKMMGPNGVDHVLYGFDYYQGLGYEVQLEKLNERLTSEQFPWSRTHSELGGVGDVMTDMLRDKLHRPDLLKEVWVDQRERSDCCKAISVISQSKRMLYVDDGRFAQQCVTDLKNVGVRYTTSSIMKPTHSDWLSAFLAPFYPERAVKVG